VNSFNYTVNTPIGQQLEDVAHPQSVELGLSIIGAAALTKKLPEIELKVPKISVADDAVGVTKGEPFSQRLFLNERFGITSKRFANSITGVKGTWNNQGGLFKMGWSTQNKYGGGMQLRI